MNRKQPWPLLLAALTILVPSLVSGEVHEFAVDPVHSEVGFKIRHLVAKTPGRFNEFTGSVWMDPNAIGETLKLSGSVQTASIDTNNEKRDGHLRSPDFFHVEKFPEMTLVSKSVKEKKGDVYLLKVDLTLLGVTQTVDLALEVTGVGMSPFTGTPNTGLEISGSINRKDFGMVWNKALDTGGVVLDDTVHLRILLEATVPSEGEKS